MPAPRKYRQELRQRPIRLVVEVREQDPEVPVMRIGSRTGAESRGARRFGVARQTLYDAL